MNKRISKDIIIISLAGVFFLTAFGFFVVTRVYKKNFQRPAKSHTIVLTKDGFEPKKLSIVLGDTVVFKTTAEKEFWPASDLHPSHSIYSEFDPKAPVSAASTWQFTFAKLGEWKFHDHLSPLYRGVITVLEKTGVSQDFDSNSCVNKNENPQACWQNIIDETLKKEGLDRAFTVMGELYSTQPLFAPACHDSAHRLGEAAYKQYSKTKTSDLSSKSFYCGYGFYHGFMEALLQASGDISEAKEFCAYVGQKLAKDTTDAENACYHGIGHGSVDGGDPRAWGDALAMLKPSLQLCETIAGNDRVLHGKLYRCTTGAYNAIEILARESKYKLEKLKNDPFYICPLQPEEYREGCYTNMLPAYMILLKNDLPAIVKISEKILEKNGSYEIRNMVISAIYHEYIRMHLNDLNYAAEAGVKECRKYLGKTKEACIEGLSGGHMKYGKPAEEYVKAMAFCGADFLNIAEKNLCYPYILIRLRIWYRVEKVKEICNAVPKEFQQYCKISE